MEIGYAIENYTVFFRGYHELYTQQWTSESHPGSLAVIRLWMGTLRLRPEVRQDRPRL